MEKTLKQKISKAAVGGAIAVAAVLVQHFEGIRYVPYKDPVGILTVCYGHTGKDIIPGKRYTQEECNLLLQKDLAIANAGVKRQIKAPLNDWQEAALTDFVFNKGEHALAGSTMRKRFNSRDYVRGCQELLKWVKATANGKLITLNGLVKRAEADNTVCLGNV